MTSTVIPFLSSDSQPIALGTCVVRTGIYVRPYDSQTDQVSDILGAITPKVDNVNSIVFDGPLIWNRTNGTAYDDFLRIKKDGNGNPIQSNSYDPNYNVITDDATQFVGVHGFVAVLNTQPTPSGWKYIEAGETNTTKIYFVV